FLLFFFSSRRRHTRFSRDWSSDVCSSDLAAVFPAAVVSAVDASATDVSAAEHHRGGDDRVLSRSYDRRLVGRGDGRGRPRTRTGDRKSTRLNSSHVKISYAVFCLKKKKNE